MFSLLYDDALPETLFALLHDRLSQTDVDPFNRHSYWYALDQAPRLLVEEAVQSLAELLPSRDGMIGVEWWIESIAPSKGVRWHYDVDHELLTKNGIQDHPVVASVLYFGGTGGPTIVVDQRPSEGDEAAPKDCDAGFAYLPAPNRFSAFPGDRLHAVAAAARARWSEMRLSLPINWWARKPGAPTCIPPPVEDREFAPLRAPRGFQLRRQARARRTLAVALEARDVSQMPSVNRRPSWPWGRFASP